MTVDNDSTKETFESAMERLEEIVGQMESGRLPLEEMLTRYEEGTKLVKLCSGKLADAEKRIEIIARNAAGKPQVEEFDPTAPIAPTPASKSSRSAASKPSDSDDVRLF
jgi:exodeoxyribonuclease VII small subunit